MTQAGQRPTEQRPVTDGPSAQRPVTDRPSEQRPAAPSAALAELIAGNERFVTGARIHPHQDAEHRASLATSQRPFAVVFGCSDSRLAAEIIFDRGLGDLFVVRTAGHIVGAEVLASIEYGVTVLGAPLVVVLGHDSCGAIAATQDALSGRGTSEPGLRALIDRVTPSIRAAGERQIADDNGIAELHVEHTVTAITRPGSALAQAVAAGRCGVVGMSYRLADGRISVLAWDDLAMPDSVVVYSVRAEFADTATRERYLQWLRDGHCLAVVREGGALSGEVSVQDDGAVESRYLFGSRADFEAYQKGPAQHLRADAERLFPPESGIHLIRAIGERAIRIPD
jgi:carbonic anhydrase